MVEPLGYDPVSPNALISVGVRTEGPVHVATVAGEVVSSTVPALRARLEPLLDGDGEESVVVDLSDVEFVDSSGLSLLVRVHKRARTSGRRLALVVTSAPVHRVFELSGLDGVLEVRRSLDEALRADPSPQAS